MNSIDQMKFLYTINRTEPQDGVTDNGNGTIIAGIRPGVQITHNYKKNNHMEIIFTEDQSHYEIQSYRELEDLLRIHLSSTNFIQPARKYCDDFLKPL